MSQHAGRLGRLLTGSLLLAAGLTATSILSPTAFAGVSPAPPDSSQLITVNAPSSRSTTATLTAWQRGSDGIWRVAIPGVRAMVGRGGTGHASEGAGVTPAGTFALTQAFGRNANPGTRLPYFTTDALDWWDENSSSPHYNLHVRQSQSPGGDSENLYYSGSVYDYVVNMDYNLARVPGVGSAFFLHVTDGTPTAGCVSVPKSVMVAILRWLDPARHPYISINVGAPLSPNGPLGSLDSVKMNGVNRISVAGWAADPTASARAEQIRVYVYGPAGTRGYAGPTTGGSRPDVARVYPWAGARSGFSTSVAPEGTGVNTVCVYAIGMTPGAGNPRIGCRRLVVQNPFGTLDAVKVSGRSIVAQGWALNPNNPAEHVRIDVYDASTAGVRGYPGFRAAASRPDIGRAYPSYGSAHGYNATIAAGVRGRHTVCAYAIATSGGVGNPLLGCRAVTV